MPIYVSGWMIGCTSIVYCADALPCPQGAGIPFARRRRPAARMFFAALTSRWAIDMKITTLLLGSMLSLLLGANAAHASEYDETIELFKHAGESAVFFNNCYAYAVFPTIGAGGLVVGGARGKGHVYVHDRVVGDTTMTQLSIGLQAGGKAYSQIIFFQDKRDLDQFESGKFEFNAGASAIAITASASASVGTDRASSEASRAATDATTNGDYQTGMAVFTIAKGGFMFAANIAGEKFSYKALSAD
jgi:lipid-binding SYLF domain-containing protein